MLESRNLWEPLRDNFKKIAPEIHLQRIENSVGNGVPDTNGCLEGRDFWLELKIAKGNRVELTPLQAAWLQTRAKAQGRAFVVARKGDTIRLWEGQVAPLVREHGWNYEPMVELTKPWDWGRLLMAVVA